MAQQVWVLAVLLGLVRPCVSLQTQRLDFLHRETKLSHLGVDEAVRPPLQGYLACRAQRFTPPLPINLTTIAQNKSIDRYIDR